MKIRDVDANNHKHAFDVHLDRRVYEFPYAACDPAPTADDRVARVYVDPELGREGFTYVLASGREGAVHADHVLEYHEDPRHLTELLLHKLTVDARKRLASAAPGKRALARRMGTSVAQLDRLLDTTNTRKSIEAMVELLAALGCSVDVEVSDREPVGAR